ncbi:MAG: Uma2 family endonuclease [Anaerolineae bacterium]
MLVEQRRIYSQSEFETISNLPENADKILELVDGEINEKVASNPYCSAVASKINFFFMSYINQNNIGYVTGEAGGYRISPKDTFAPDVAYISKLRQPNLPYHGFNPIPPDLAVEVVSPSDSYVEVAKKVRTYLRYGTHLVWVVEPETQTVTIYALDGSQTTLDIDGELDGGEVLPGFKLPVRSIFPA